MLKQRQIIAFILLALCCCSKFNEANVIFHFGIDFTVKDADTNSTEIDQHFNKTIEVTNKEIKVIDNTTGKLELPAATTNPVTDIETLRSQQSQLNEAIVAKLSITKAVIEKLNRDLTPAVGRSDYLSGKVKSTIRYLNKLEEVGEEPRLELLEEFVSLVDVLKEPPSSKEGGERTVEYILMKVLLDKHGIIQLQEHVRDMNEEVRHARKSWQRYIKLKLVEVAV